MPLNAKLRELDAEKNRLAAEVGAAPDEKPQLHPALAMALYDEKGGRQAFERLRSVVEEVRPTRVEGQLAIELRGDLAEILHIGAPSAQCLRLLKKKALQINVVAGGRIALGIVCERASTKRTKGSDTRRKATKAERAAVRST